MSRIFPRRPDRDLSPGESWHRLARVAVSIGLIAALLAVCLRVRHLNDATVALLAVLCIFCVAINWGWVEALAAAVAGGLGFDYYFLPPRGSLSATPEHWIAVIAFCVTAVATGQLAAQAKRRRVSAERQHQEIEKLYQLVNAVLESHGTEACLLRLAEKVAEIFSASEVALYAKFSGQIVRAGANISAKISDDALREVAISGQHSIPALVPYAIAPIRHGGELSGSIGILGARVSSALLDAITGRLGLGFARLYAIEQATEAEILRRSEELKSAVLDALAHEIRNPLNSIKLAASALLAERAGSEMNKKEMLTIIDEEADRMNRFIDESVQLARMEASELRLNKEPQNLARLIPAAVEDLGELAAQRTIEVQVPESLPAAGCDQKMILLVLNRLLNNALKYSPAGSPLFVTAQLAGADIVVDVVDQGPGVAEDERERIFEKYYRGRAARSGTAGTGLGLPAAKCIVQAHGGNIWVTTPPGGGAAFHISLPVADTSHAVGVL